ncbi:MAG: hypothetical protein QNJ47_05090 [Nostocaceae cyanobacterium]|nr:hypothetical protein [Nostocaceae cyanobacterium]
MLSGILSNIQIFGYFFKKDGKVLSQQKLKFNFAKECKKEEIMEQAGFAFVGIHDSQKFHIYRKK